MNKEINSKKAVILIVEDEVESQKFFELILRKKFEMDFCDSLRTMNTLLKEKIYDAVIMDISLKDGNNGFDLIKEIRRSSTRTEIPIICLSAHMYDEDKLRAKQAGADVYLTKPVKGQLLVSTLEELLVADTKKGK
ncbi:MAG: response regulator [bacterium]|nr:response regulator [bacterium]